MKTAGKVMNWLRTKKIGAKTSLLNKQGIEMMELKKKMLENYGTPLFKQLEANVLSLEVSQKVKNGLVYSPSLEAFEGVLLSETVYFIQDKEYQQVVLKQKLNESIDYLLTCKENGQFVCGHFGEHTFYSDTMTRDSAYIQVTGYTQSQREEHRQQVKQEWMDAAKGILRKDKKEVWEKMVETQLKSFFGQLELKTTLAVSKVLSHNGTLAEARKEFEDVYDVSFSTELIFEMIEQVSERGTDFVKHMNLYIR